MTFAHIFFYFSVVKFVSGTITRASTAVKPVYYQLLPLMCMYETNEFEPVLAKYCVQTLACLSSAILPMDVIPVALDTVAEVAKKGTSWKMKTAVLQFLEVKRIKKNI